MISPVPRSIVYSILAVVLLASCSDEPTRPEPSIAGTWDLIGFSDAGVVAVTTGTAVFRTDGTFSIDGTVTFPGEPTDPIRLNGTYRQTGVTVELSGGGERSTWSLQFTGNQAVLTQIGPPPSNTITLRRRG